MAKNSWLRDHFYNFVFPAVKLAATVSNKTSTDLGEPFDVQLTEAERAEGGPTELKKLYKLCNQLNVQYDGSRRTSNTSALHFDVLRQTLLSAESLRKSKGYSHLLLTGRDVWQIEVMARRRRIPTLFLPEVSRLFVRSTGPAAKEFMLEKGVTDNMLLIDTGFVGSIPLGMSEKLGFDIPFALMSQDVKNGTKHAWIPGAVADKRPNELFPCRKGKRAEALATEYLPKYFCSGTVKNGKVVQYLAEAQEIAQAAVLTSDIWRGIKQSPNNKWHRLKEEPTKKMITKPSAWYGSTVTTGMTSTAYSNTITVSGPSAATSGTIPISNEPMTSVSWND